MEGYPDDSFRLIDQDGNEIPYQLTDKHNIRGNRDEVLTFLFVAEKVPSLAIKLTTLRKESPQPLQKVLTMTVIHMRTAITRSVFSDGGIRSLYDKELSANLMKTDKFLGAELFTMQSVGNGAGEFTDVQQPTMEGFEKMSQYSQPLVTRVRGPSEGCL